MRVRQKLQSFCTDAKLYSHFVRLVRSLVPVQFFLTIAVAMLLRHDLDGIARAFPNRKRVVLIGHSMGGMIARLMVTDAGDRIWRDFFGTPPANTPLTGETRHLLEQALVFNHRPEIKRVVFISTPHRGSSLASGWIGRLGASLVRAPRFMASVYASFKPLEIAGRTLVA